MTIVIISGFFNPLHGGHLDMIEAAKQLGDKLVVIVNNDRQQLLKKKQIILNEATRMRLIRALRDVDEVVLSIDETPSVIATLEKIVTEFSDEYPYDNFIFANGGDRDSVNVIPEAEVCNRYAIELVFGVGGGKTDSSTRINQAVYCPPAKYCRKCGYWHSKDLHPQYLDDHWSSTYLKRNWFS